MLTPPSQNKVSPTRLSSSAWPALILEGPLMLQAAALQRQPTSAAAGKFKVAVLGADHCPPPRIPYDECLMQSVPAERSCQC